MFLNGSAKEFLRRHPLAKLNIDFLRVNYLLNFLKNTVIPFHGVCCNPIIHFIFFYFNLKQLMQKQSNYKTVIDLGKMFGIGCDKQGISGIRKTHGF